MKISKDWLQQWLPLNMDTRDLAEKITAVGLEVEGIDDQGVIDISIPPNRGDCLSVFGIARELAAITKQQIKKPEFKIISATTKDTFSIKIKEVDACPRYLGRVISGINNKTQTPEWVKKHLLAAEINPISLVVDITNYVMLELGQPLHAFDLDKLNGSIIVRFAKDSEKITLLDDQEIKLNDETLIIADKKNPLAIAGVMGGKDSGVLEDTTNIFLECAYFEPIGVRLSARKYNIHTESSHRFERTVDPTLQEYAMDRATGLILEIAGGNVGEIIKIEDSEYIPEQREIVLRKSRIEQILGIVPDSTEVGEILQSLGMEILAHENGWQVKVPSFRPDLELEIDLIEEIARIQGFDKIPSILPQTTLEFMSKPESRVSLRTVQQCLVNRGYHEAITYSFVDNELEKLLFPNGDCLPLVNPISQDMSVMRTSLWSGLLKAVQYNQHRQQQRVRLFETGLSFRIDNKSNQLEQKFMLSGVCSGNILTEQWGSQSRAVDFFDIKGDIEALCNLVNKRSKVTFRSLDGSVEEKQHATALHDGQKALICLEDKILGIVGALHPRIIKEMDLHAPIYVFEIDYNILTNGKIPKFAPLSKFPSVRRDLAILIDEEITASEVINTVNKIDSIIKDFSIFDIYQGKNLEAGKKSLTLGVLLQHPQRTLTDKEVNLAIDKVVDALGENLGAVLRV